MARSSPEAKRRLPDEVEPVRASEWVDQSDILLRRIEALGAKDEIEEVQKVSARG